MNGYLIVSIAAGAAAGAMYFVLYVWSSHRYSEWLHDCSGLTDVILPVVTRAPARPAELLPPARPAFSSDNDSMLVTTRWAAPTPM